MVDMFYSVQGRRFENKFEAMQEATRLNKPVSFHADDDFWSQVDWKNPCTLSLEGLYTLRAHQLRAKYDYIILAYSGGPDSWNTLRSFERANCLVDEIVSWHDKSITGSECVPQNAEVFKVARPIAEEYVRQNPSSRYTLLDIKPSLKRIYSQNMDDFLLFNTTSLSVNTPIRYGHWFYDVPRWVRMVEQGKRVCLLWGYDKTLIHNFAGRYGFAFNDFTPQYTLKRGVVPVSDEFFYWSMESPCLVVKQCHALRTFLDALSETWVDPLPVKEKRNKVTAIYSKTGKRVTLRTINRILYGPGPYAEQKPDGSYFLTEWDYWVKDYMSEDIFAKWRKVMLAGHEMYRKIGSENRDKWNPQFGDKPVMITAPHFIE